MVGLILKIITCLFISQNLFASEPFSTRTLSLDFSSIRYRLNGNRNAQSIFVTVYLVGRSNNRWTEVRRDSLGKLAPNREVGIDSFDPFVFTRSGIQHEVRTSGILANDPLGHDLVVKFTRYRTVVDENLFSFRLPITDQEGERMFRVASADGTHSATVVLAAYD